MSHIGMGCSNRHFCWTVHAPAVSHFESPVRGTPPLAACGFTRHTRTIVPVGGFAMIVLPEVHFRAVTEHASSAYPEECCGALLGHRGDKGRTVADVIRCRNVHDTPTTRYAIDPAELVTLQRKARERGLEIVGFYHSHPDRPSYVSRTDLEEAHWLDCSYIIASVEQGSVAQVRSFELPAVGDEKQFTEEPLIVSYAEVKPAEAQFSFSHFGRISTPDLS